MRQGRKEEEAFWKREGWTERRPAEEDADEKVVDDVVEDWAEDEEAREESTEAPREGSEVSLLEDVVVGRRCCCWCRVDCLCDCRRWDSRIARLPSRLFRFVD